MIMNLYQWYIDIFFWAFFEIFYCLQKSLLSPYSIIVNMNNLKYITRFFCELSYFSHICKYLWYSARWPWLFIFLLTLKFRRGGNNYLKIVFRFHDRRQFTNIRTPRVTEISRCYGKKYFPHFPEELITRKNLLNK